MHTSLHVVYRSSNKQKKQKTLSVSFSHVPHAAYTYLLKLTVYLRLLHIFSVLLWASALVSSTVLHIVTYLHY